MRSWMPWTALTAVALLAAPSATPLSAQTVIAPAGSPLANHAPALLFSAQRDSLVALARTQVGALYRWGAKAPGKAFDCSGLVQWVMARFQITLPRTSREQAKQGIAIPADPEQLLPGDLLYFSSGKRVDHVGIYIGEGKFIHAANRRKGVIIADLPRGGSWWKGARRLFTSLETISDVPTVAFESAGSIGKS